MEVNFQHRSSLHWNFPGAANGNEGGSKTAYFRFMSTGFFLRSADYSIKGGSQTWPTTSGCLQEAKFSLKRLLYQLLLPRLAFWWQWTVMASIRLAFDTSAGNKTPHIVPQCFDPKDVDNATTRFTLANYDAKDGGIPINFGLNCLGWMVNKISFCMLQYFAPVFEYLIVLLCLYLSCLWFFGPFGGNDNKTMQIELLDSLDRISLCVFLLMWFLASN